MENVLWPNSSGVRILPRRDDPKQRLELLIAQAQLQNLLQQPRQENARLGLSQQELALRGQQQQSATDVNAQELALKAAGLGLDKEKLGVQAKGQNQDAEIRRQTALLSLLASDVDPRIVGAIAEGYGDTTIKNALGAVPSPVTPDSQIKSALLAKRPDLAPAAATAAANRTTQANTTAPAVDGVAPTMTTTPEQAAIIAASNAANANLQPVNSPNFSLPNSAGALLQRPTVGVHKLPSAPAETPQFGGYEDVSSFVNSNIPTATPEFVNPALDQPVGQLPVLPAPPQAPTPIPTPVPPALPTRTPPLNPLALLQQLKQAQMRRKYA